MATIIQSRHDTAARWASINPTLAEGELGIETDTGKIKVGDGVTVWNSLAYFTGDAPVKSVNSKTGAVLLDASDVGALPSNTQYQEPINDLATIRAGAAAGATAVQPAALNDYVPTSTTVNGKALSSNVTLDADDVGAPSDIQVNGTSVVTSGVANIPIAGANSLGVMKVNENTYGIGVNQSNGLIYIKPATESELDSKTSQNKPVVPANLNYAVRSVSPACTTITAADTTATLTANTTYAHKPATGCTYTLTTPTDLTVYSGFILMLDTTDSASIAFQTDDTPATSIVLNGNPTIETGKRYTVTGQYSVLNNAWELWIIEYSAT